MGIEPERCRRQKKRGRRVVQRSESEMRKHRVSGYRKRHFGDNPKVVWFKSRPRNQKKRTENFSTLFQRYKFLTEFAIYLRCDILLHNAICCLTATRFISYRVLSETKNISNLQSKYIARARASISPKSTCIYIVRLCHKKETVADCGCFSFCK